MWEPWKGRDYEVARLLLLGESAYSWVQDGKEVHPSPRHSILTVEEAVTDFPTTPFAIMLTRGVAGKANPTRQDREAGWARVAFTNYVPGTVGGAARIRPSLELWAQAKAEFPDLLRKLRPKNVIVLGKTMWEMMPDTQLWLLPMFKAIRLTMTVWPYVGPSRIRRLVFPGDGLRRWSIICVSGIE